MLERFDVPVEDALAGLEPPEWYLPPSLVGIEVDTDHPIGLGMPEHAAAKFAGGRAYVPAATWNPAVGGVEVVAAYSDADVLESGILVGEEHLAGRGAIVSIAYGEGRIILYGLRVQHRAQTHGTFKLLFNALLQTRASSEESTQ